MDIYELLVVSVLVTALLMRGYRQENKAYVIVAGFLLFAVYGLRDGTKIGADALSYLHGFERMRDYSVFEAATIGGGENIAFFLLEKVVYAMTNGDFQVLVTGIAVFVSICFSRLIYRYSPNPLMSILMQLGLLLYVFHFTALKQSIAMGFIMLAFSALVEQKPFRFLFLVVIGAQFHMPAYVFLMAYPITKLRPSRSFLLLLAAALVVTYLFRTQILQFLTTLYKDDNNKANTVAEGVGFLRTKSLIMIGIVIIAVVFRKPKAEHRIYWILLELMCVAIIFQTFCGYSNIYERLADYFFQFSVLFIPMVFDKKADREPLLNWRLMDVIDFAAPFLFCGFAIYRFITYTQNDRYLYPFKFFFQN